MRIEKIGLATLYLGDCREVLPTLAPCDLILTDPPYGIGIAANPVRQAHERMEWDAEAPAAWLFGLMQEKAKNLIVWGGNYFPLPPAKCWLVWDKDNGETDFADCELAWTNLPKAVRRLRWRWQGMLQQDMANKEEREHPTQKPVPVMRWALMQAKDVLTVCDPYMGSGTTGVACVMEGLQFVGIERERKYFDIACERIYNAYRQNTLFGQDENVQEVPASQTAIEFQQE